MNGQLIWGRLKGYDWWPGLVVSYMEAQKAPPSPSNHWVKWFGDNKFSLVCIIISSNVYIHGFVLS